MIKIFNLIALLSLFFVLNCSSSQTQSSEPDNGRVRGRKKNVETSQALSQVPAPKKAAPIALHDLKDFIRFYQKTLEVLGKKKSDDSYVVDSDTIEEMKQQMGSLLQVEPAYLTFLVNPINQGAWFGNCTLAIEKKQERLVIIDKDGREQRLSLKDKIFGGLYKTEQNDWVFLSAFYGDLQKKVPYRIFWGAQELKVISFTFDRSKEGTVEAQAKSVSGNMLKVYRKARDNKSVQVNGQVLSPVFE